MEDHDHNHNQDTDQGRAGQDGAHELHELARRVTELERQVVTIAAAVDAASRMRVAPESRLDQGLRVSGGRLVRRILEKGRLVEDYGSSRRTG